jgi:hypothetical protein
VPAAVLLVAERVELVQLVAAPRALAQAARVRVDLVGGAVLLAAMAPPVRWHLI